jgi:ferritin
MDRDMIAGALGALRLKKKAAAPVEPVEASKESPVNEQKPEAGTQAPTSFLSKETAALLARQIGNEVFSCYAYYAVAGWFHNQGLDGFQKLFDKQAGGELVHFKKIYDYLLEAGQEFAMPPVGAPDRDYADVAAACEAVVKLEKAVTADWRAIHKAAVADQDAATIELAQWFVSEQMEEEDLVFTLLQRVRMASKDGILTIDAALMD